MMRSGQRSADFAGTADRPRRIVLLDAIRGLAILGMIMFHLNWDLADFGYVRTSPTMSVPWTLLGNGVASAFLMLSGVGLVLARARGCWPALRRLAVIAVCAATVTVITAWLFPQETITFGILHCIAVTNVVALALLERPIWLLVLLSAAALAAPWLLASGLTEGPPWWWLGLSIDMPRTLDYRPVLPWLGLVLLGVVAARTLPLQACLPATPRWTMPLARAGRHSLMIYMVHQPILFGMLWVLTLGWPPQQADRFLPACQAECQATGAGQAGCRAACLCAAQTLGHAAPGKTDRPDPAAVARACVSPSE